MSFKKYVKPWGLGHGPFVVGSRLFTCTYLYVHCEPQLGKTKQLQLSCAHEIELKGITKPGTEDAIRVNDL